MTRDDFGARLDQYLDDLAHADQLARAYRAHNERVQWQHERDVELLRERQRVASPQPAHDPGEQFDLLRPVGAFYVYSRATEPPQRRRNFWPLLGWAILLSPWLGFGLWRWWR